MNTGLTTEERAALWRVKRDDADWSERDEAELNAWLSASTSHRVAWLRMEYGWQRIGRLSALREAHRPVSRSVWSRIPSRLYAALGAAAVVSAILVGMMVVLQRPGTQQQYLTGIGRQLSVEMNDGSRIEMNADSSLRISPDARTVWLDRGEAYFEVAHDASHPFVVNAGNHRVVVLGTKFSVRTRGTSLLVVVDSGLVRVNEASADSGAGIVAGRHVVVTADGGQAPMISQNRSAEDELAWREGMLVFKDSTLTAVAAEFNRYNLKQLRVEESPGLPRISGRFGARELDAFVRLLAKAYNLRVVDRGSYYEVSS